MNQDPASPQDNSNTETSDNPAKPHDRTEYQAKYYEENKAEISARRKAKRQANQEEISAAERERYATDPAIREQRLKINAKGRQTQKERIATDPEAKKRHEEQLAKRRQKHQERLANDPEYRQQREDFKKALREKRQKKSNPEQQEKAGDEPQ